LRRDRGRDRGKIYSRREGVDGLMRRDRREHAREGREKKKGERKGKGRGRVKRMEEVDTGEEMQGRGIEGETCER
jgi:hypothetical protein